MKAHRASWAVTLMASVLMVSASGFYAWLKRPKSKRAKENELLTEKIIMFHCGSRFTYGSPRIHRDLIDAGYKASRGRVARLMNAASIRGKTKRKFKVTTNSKHKRPKADNLVKQNFSTSMPDTLWASDISYISTAEGWLYLAVTLDLFSRKVIGWAFSDRLMDDLTLAALDMATKQRGYLRAVRQHTPKAKHRRTGLHRKRALTTKSVKHSHVPIKDRIRSMRSLGSIETGQRLLEGSGLTQAVWRGNIRPPDWCKPNSVHKRAKLKVATFSWLALGLRITA